MRRRTFFTMVALVLLASFAVGGIYAMAAGSPAKATSKVIILLKPQGNGNEVVAKLGVRAAKDVYRYHVIAAVAATVSQDTLKALLKDGNVLAVVPDRRIPAPKIPTGAEGRKLAPKAAKATATVLESEALQLTHAQDTWSIKVNGHAVKGQGVRVGLLDTGTDPVHPDLGPAVEAYRDFTGTGLQDNVGHGTATSGCVAAQGLPVYNPETGTLMRYAGMAPMAKVLMAKVGDLNGGWDSQFIRGIEWLIDEKVDIVSDSWGGFALPPDGKDPVSLVVAAAIRHHITFCVSAFNEGPGQGTLGSPSDLKDALTVGASTGAREFSQIGFMASGSAYKGDQVITWTSRGPNASGDSKPDILGFGAYGWALAPTAGSDEGGPNIMEFGGTSMAAPVVAGNLALVESAWKMLHPGKALPSPAYWKQLLASTATDLGYPALDQSSGLVNSQAAVREVLKQGASFLVGVSADSHNPSSWSPRVAQGGTATTTLTVRNTGAVKEHVTLRPTVFWPSSPSITRKITLTGPDYFDAENFVVPAGTDFVQVRLTWPSAPSVSIRTAVYDSDGNFITYAPTYGGYGHLSLDQISLTGPAGQRPVVRAGHPWEVDIFPRGGMEPTSPQQVNLHVEFLRKATWPAVKLSTSSFTLWPGNVGHATVTLKAPKAAGTFFGGIVVSNGTATSTVPVSERVPVALSSGHGTFHGTIQGSTVEYNGGEFYFYDFQVPAGTRSVSASLTWPHQGNLVNLYLVDPNGTVRDAKGGDLTVADYSVGSAPADALTHTAEQVVWDAPTPGKWQALVWAPGFSGTSFGEPYTGTITLGQSNVTPTTWTASAPPGGHVSAEFTVVNHGPTSLSAYADSQASFEGIPRFDDIQLMPTTGQLKANGTDFQQVLGFTVPQRTVMMTAAATWIGPNTLVDLGLYDPVGTDKAESLAMTDLGNSLIVQNPMAGAWSITVAYGNPALPPATVDYTVNVDYVTATPIAGLTPSATSSTPVTVPIGGSSTIDATIDVPADASPGDTITGTLDFYTVGDQVVTAGGDHLGSIPVTITVAPPI